VGRIGKFFCAVKHQRQIRELVSTQLAILENDGEFAFGGLTDEEERGIGELLRKHRESGSGPIIEFGTLFGVTTLLLASLKAEGQKVITVDNFCWNPFGLRPEQHKAFTRKILRYGLASGDVELAELDSSAFRACYAGPVPHMVFLDADHTYASVKDEIAWAKRMGVSVIAGHDYGHPVFGVTRAVDEAFPQGVNVRGSVWWNRP
jgi:hypothetical protein